MFFWMKSLTYRRLFFRREKIVGHEERREYYLLHSADYGMGF